MKNQKLHIIYIKLSNRRFKRIILIFLKKLRTKFQKKKKAKLHINYLFAFIAKNKYLIIYNTLFINYVG